MRQLRLVAVGLAVLSVLIPAQVASAADAFPDQSASGSVGLQGTITSAAPTRGATITSPSSGTVFTNVPITVNGICPANVLVKIFANNVFVGSVFCANGSYSLQVNLFSGQNELVARVYDALDQAGPDSNVVSVTYNDAQFAQYGSHVQLSSVYAQRGAAPGQELTWPITISGGVGPYAISVDWGDGTSTDLISQTSPGNLTLKHTYRNAGIYKVIVKATDKNGGTAFLQLVGQATGAGQSGKSDSGKDNNMMVQVKVLWWPALAMLPLIFAAFWVGRRHELFSLRKQLEKSRDNEGM